MTINGIPDVPEMVLRHNALFREACDYFRREHPSLTREQVEKKAGEAVIAWLDAQGPEPACFAPPTPQPEENPEEYTPLVMAAKANGVIK